MKPWRIVVISAVLPVAEPLIASLQAMGHDVVAWLMARRPQDKDKPPPMWGEVTDKTAPQGINLLMVRDKADLAGLLRGLEPDVALCWGFGWKIPQEALDVPRYGIVNQHPAPLPRFRGPIPMSWAMREGDPVFGITWHRMDAELDTDRCWPRRRSRSSTRRRRSSRPARACSRRRWGKVTRTLLTDPGDGSPAVETADGTIWILESEPYETDPPA